MRRGKTLLIGSEGGATLRIVNPGGARLASVCKVPHFALFALSAKLGWRATNPNNAKCGTGVADAAKHS
jgi:hypothetical protein